ncbi:MAG: 2OG-Fe(II) oxygenase [Pseudomonadota bacterium]
MSYLRSNPSDPFVFDIDDMKDVGAELTEAYAAADPFPHAVVDDFLPESLIDYCLDHFPQKLDADGMSFDRDQERFKKSYHPDYLEPDLRKLFYSFNSRPFIRVIENITGIKGLIPDPYFAGGGFHEISTGGHLSMHADFNHHKPLNLERRVNVLIYLNRDWKEEYGGQLELWRTDMSERVQSIVPLANRCVIFTTTQQSMHGNPTPVAHPDGVSRKSIALYYYTATWDGTAASKTTQFKTRPGTADRVDWSVKTNELMHDLLPPALMRLAAKARRRL